LPSFLPVVGRDLITRIAQHCEMRSEEHVRFNHQQFLCFGFHNPCFLRWSQTFGRFRSSRNLQYRSKTAAKQKEAPEENRRGILRWTSRSGILIRQESPLVVFMNTASWVPASTRRRKKDEYVEARRGGRSIVGPNGTWERRADGTADPILWRTTNVLAHARMVASLFERRLPHASYYSDTRLVLEAPRSPLHAIAHTASIPM